MRDNKGGFVKGNIPYMTGRHHSETSREKSKLSHLGKHSSPDTEFKKGQLAWNKGKPISEWMSKENIKNYMR